MKRLVIIFLLVLPFEAMGECSHAPFELIWAEKYRDGGTISLTVTDSAGCVAGFSLDWGIKSETFGRIYYRAIPQLSERAGLSSKEEEEEILDLLCLVADSNMSRARQKEILEKGCKGSGEDEAESCRYCGWLMELLQKAGRR